MMKAGAGISLAPAFLMRHFLLYLISENKQKLMNGNERIKTGG